ncbi:citrinin biosynthesis transporter CtnC [Cucurbitaria berberidis CBS 394.84]|uniref:Citrinin biosynthesis transporter CtnC n=1 Tax=Cucurbitaria berberidis CBS 394.84 TaxID=1168544 RepID=A0A9P4GDH4_9PLEO|nr:citrinin biosynthesis transporter CtnC [Cucurbitaria berberidis CBS 394.84]KAF1843249.1 citrinin biosynthesis transporter CtnC [Cucurbitaria berberidis CBS 394.84]
MPTHQVNADPALVRTPSTPASTIEGVADGKLRKSEEDLNGTSDVLPADLEKGPNETPAPIQQKPFFVDFDGPNDPGNPKNWTTKRRWGITISMGLLVFTVTFASSIFSVNIGVVEQKFGVDSVTATLGVSLFVLGFVFGPIIFGPMSEVLGRRIPLFAGMALFALFQIPVALAQNIETICVGRFISGFFAAAPLATTGGALADLWDPIPRAYAICVFAAGGFAGPVAGPIAGGFMAESNLGWRWTSWLTLIMAAFFGAIGLFVIPETSAARILQLRAAKLRKDTGNTEYHSKADENKLTVHTVVNVTLLRPFVMIVEEPILALVTAYMSFLYGIVYLLFEAYPVSFHQERDWSLGVSQLPFTAFIVGIILGAGIIAYSTATNFTRSYVKHGKAIPEERLPPMIVGAVILPIGLFMFAWTSNPNITWVPQVIATALIGVGCMVPFWQGMSYLIDCYGFYANSAIAVNTFMRSIAGAFFPLFTHAMYRNLGVAWATSLLGFLCVAFLPVPILFYIYGAKIRAKSKWAPTAN